MKGYRILRRQILEKLEALSPILKYHGYHHTMDVLKVCNGYIRRMKLPKREATLLRIAALAHDIGFIETHVEHERIGAKMTSTMMSELNFDEADIEEVVKMIIATKVGNPTTTLLEKIICDADLDYLGRPDFEEISNTLYQELQNLSLIDDYDTWMKLQVNFLEKHVYFTDWAKKYRASKKKKWLEHVRQKIQN